MIPSSALRSANAIAPTTKNERGKKRSLDEDNVEQQKDEKRQKEASPSRLFSAVTASSVPDNQVASHQESSLQSIINSFLVNPDFPSQLDLSEEFINIITDFNAKGLLTKENLNFTTQDGPYKGVNVVWALACYCQWDILKSLKDKNLLTQELIASTAQDGPDKGKNVVWFLAFYYQWEILKSLNDKDLLTKETLASTPQDGFAKGKNVVWILAHFQQGEILISLNNKNLLNSIHFKTKFGKQNALEKLFRAAEEAGNLNPSKLNFINKLLLKIEEIDEYTLLMLNRYLNLVLQKEKNTPITEQVNYSDSEKLFLMTLRKKVPIWINAPQPNRNIFSALFYPGEREYPQAYSIVTSYQLTEETLLEISTTPELPNVLIDLIQSYRDFP